MGLPLSVVSAVSAPAPSPSKTGVPVPVPVGVPPVVGLVVLLGVRGAKVGFATEQVGVGVALRGEDLAGQLQDLLVGDGGLARGTCCCILRRRGGEQCGW